MWKRNAALAPSLVLLAAGCLLGTVAAPAAVTDYVAVKRVASGLDRPVFVTTPPGDNDRLFVVEQHTGRIKILDLTVDPVGVTTFLDLAGLSTGSEQGLLGLAFHPDYAVNGYFYVNFTDTSRATNIVRYQVSADPDVADPASATPLLTFGQPQINHNGGWIGFGPDGYLYIASGDGGGGNDNATGHTPGIGNAQDITNNLLGKMLRIDVNGDDFPVDPLRNYAIPADNPFVGATGDDEIWSFGLRNPWRASFDRVTGDLYIADVGQKTREEVDFQLAASPGGENYGWRLREGSIATPTGNVGGPRPPGAVDPIYDYTHGGGPTQGFSVTGGYVYRGPNIPLTGKYFFGDYVNDRVWSVEHDGTSITDFMDWTDAFTPDAGSLADIASFGEDAQGNLYIVDLGGELFRVESTCTLALTLSYAAGTLSMDFKLALPVASQWTTFLVASGGAAVLWSVPIEALPETDLLVPVPGFPDLGTIGVITLLSNDDGILCIAVDVVDTGP